MSEMITGVTAGGAAWTPRFVQGIDQTRCIGCGRCFKVCPRDVFDLIDRADTLEADDIDDYEDLDEDNAQVMSIANGPDCIGCSACSRVCPKNCFTHAPLPQAA
jgi:Nif-specific ferredoxin III